MFDIFIIYDLTADDNYLQFKKDVYDFFDVEENINDDLPNTTIRIGLKEEVKSFNKITKDLADYLEKKYNLKKLLLIHYTNAS